MSTSERVWTRGRRRLIGGVAGVSMLAALTLGSTVQVTDAAFTDLEYGRTTITAFTVPAPAITSCTVQNNVLGGFQSVTLIWTSPYPANGVRLTLTQGATTAVVPAANITTTGPVGGVYTHTAVLSQNLLLALLANLLGSTTTLTVNNLLVGTTWTSVGVSRQLTLGLLGTGGTCT